MKIEIEFEEVNRLHQEIQLLKDDKELLEKELKSLNKDELKKQAVQLAAKVFDNWIIAVFKKIGFQNDPNDFGFGHIGVGNELLSSYLGKSRYSDPIEVTIGATVTDKFKEAFIRLGIDPNVNNEL